MKVLLTGSTGFLGFRLLEQLVINPDIEKIIAAGRKIRQDRFIEHPKVEYRLGDLSNKEYVDSLVTDIDAIIHSAALSAMWGKRKHFEVANVHSQLNLVEAALSQGIEKFIYISTAAVYAEFRDKINVFESDPLPSKFVNLYAETKQEAEDILLNSGIPYIIFRPRGIVGRGDDQIMPRLLRAYEEGKLKMVGRGDNLIDVLSAANFAELIEYSLWAEPQAWNHIYNVSNDQPIKMWDLVNKVLERLGKEKVDSRVSYPLLMGVASILELKSKLTNYKEPVITRMGVTQLARSFTVNVDKSKNRLQYRPRMDNDAVIEEFIVWQEQLNS